MRTTIQNQSTKRRDTDKREAYETPAIIHESLITTRAGTPIEPGSNPGVDPADLFGG